MKEKLFYWISFGIALVMTTMMFVISIVNDWLIIEILCGIFAISLSYVYKVIRKKTVDNSGKGKLVYDREKDGKLT